ncbi:MAG: hypothetical protein JST16_11680 [Bdellovibrionales bacterium]|nr:hypothetical protein [Bdellovibrionales bacterium]
MDEILSFLPRLYSEGVTLIYSWHVRGNEGTEIGTFSWPEYNPLVVEFFQVAAKECWRDCEYATGKDDISVENVNALTSATMDQVKNILTFFVRGERFCDGHWASVIESGYVRRVLERIGKFRCASAL